MYYNLYKQINDTWGSDHYPIEFDIETVRKVYRKRTNRISTKKTDWNIYKQIITEKEIKLDEYKNLGNSDKYERIVKDKNKCHDCNLWSWSRRKKRRKDNLSKKKGKNTVTWWDEECHQVTEERKKKHKE